MGDASKVSVGKPRTAGAIYRAPLGSTLPTSANATIDTAVFTEIGYISEDGVTEQNSTDSEEITAWGGDTVATPQTKFSHKYKFAMIEALNSAVQATVYGEDNVSGTLSTGLTVEVTADEHTEYVWVIDMILRNGALCRTVMPDAKVSEIGDITYKDNEVIKYDVTVACAPDTDGQYAHKYYYLA